MHIYMSIVPRGLMDFLNNEMQLVVRYKYEFICVYYDAFS